MTTTRITQAELESYLWGAAVLLRGLIDAGDYKQYIFPLVFIKRLSDVYDEERATALALYGDEDMADLPENHRFVIPDGAHWADIRTTPSNVGAKILRAMRTIEAANPDTLHGVFGEGDWENKDFLPDRTLRVLPFRADPAGVGIDSERGFPAQSNRLAMFRQTLRLLRQL